MWLAGDHLDHRVRARRPGNDRELRAHHAGGVCCEHVSSVGMIGHGDAGRG